VRSSQREQGTREQEEWKKNFLISHENLELYQIVFDVAMKIFQMSKKFPVEMNIYTFGD
jgi:hypothetical protein